MSKTGHKIRVFLLDDHPIVRFGFKELISRQPDIEVVGEAGTSREAFESVLEDPPDILIADVTLPDRSGLSLLKDLDCMKERPRVLVVSMHDEMVYAERVLRAGAHGYIMKENAAENVVSAIRDIMNGELFVSDRVKDRLLKTLTSGKEPKCVDISIDILSDRQLEVWEHIGHGKTAQEIAELLDISPKTVDAHRAKIKEKLGYSDSHALMLAAVRWVESQDKSE